jgi:hypothetical protein
MLNWASCGCGGMYRLLFFSQEINERYGEARHQTSAPLFFISCCCQNPYTQQPMDYAAASVLASESDVDCRRIVEQTTSRPPAITRHDIRLQICFLETYDPSTVTSRSLFKSKNILKKCALLAITKSVAVFYNNKFQIPPLKHKTTGATNND